MPIDPFTGAWIGAQIGGNVAQLFEKNPHTGLFAEKPDPEDFLPYMTPEEHKAYMNHYFANSAEHELPPGFVPPTFTDEELERILQHDMHSNPAYSAEMAALVEKAQKRAPGSVKQSRLYDDPEPDQGVQENRTFYHNPQVGRDYSLGDSGLQYQTYTNPQTGRSYSMGDKGVQYKKKGGSVMTENGELKAPWKADQAPKMLVVHISVGELEGLDDLQGGESIDPETGLREYSKLATIIEEPEIRELFKNVYADVSDGELSPQMRSLYEQAKQQSAHFSADTPVEHTEPTKDIEQTGTPPDHHMAIIPENLALFFVELSHTVDLNPETGLLQFGGNNFFRSVVRIAGTVGGAYFGGPFGAAAGNMAARAATGQRFGTDMLFAGAKNAAYTYGAQALGQMAGLGSPGGIGGYGAAGTRLGGMASQGFGPNNYGAYGSFFGNAAPAAPAAPVVTGAGATPVAGAAAPAATAAGTAPAAGAGWMDKLTTMAPWAAMALSMHGQKQHHQDQMKAWEHGQRERERAREDAGFNIKPRKVKPAVYKKNPAYTVGPQGESSEPMYLREDDVPEYRQGGKVPTIAHAALGSYSQGTLIKGPGKGQDDKIRTRVPEGSYIIDASTVANLGDGSSEAGAKVLKECEAVIRRKHAHKKTNPMKSAGLVDVFLSNDEYKFDPETVSILGKGNNLKGSKILKTMVKNIRRDKNRNGDRLPPKAKHPLHYMKINKSSLHRGAL